MANEGNALADLAEQLKNYHSQGPAIDKAQRIVALVADVEAARLDFLKKCADGSPEAEEAASKLQTAKRFLVDECRRIAEEGN